jgi:hypothetical protein
MTRADPALVDFALFRLELERASISVRGFRVSSAEQQIKTLACPRIPSFPILPHQTESSRSAHAERLFCCP